MEEFPYGFGIRTSLSPEQAEHEVRRALAEEGFGVLTEIDVAATMKAKLGVERPPYKILGACNPSLAHRALSCDEQIGLLLPCNVVVYEDDGGSVVAFMDPVAALGIVGNDALKPIADEARARLLRVREKLASL